MEGTRYIEIPATAIEAFVAEAETKLVASGGSVVRSVVGHEQVVDFVLPRRQGLLVRFFTSVPANGDAVRACGEDAIRIFVGTKIPLDRGGEKFIPLSESKRVFRTAPTKLPHEERVAAFMTRLRGTMREVYVEATTIPICQKCSRPMKERTGGRGPFLGCTGYPSCRNTAQVPRLAS